MLRPTMRGQRYGLTVVMTAIVLGTAGAAHAALPSSVPRATWVPDAPPRAVEVIGDRAYIAGEFSHIGPYTGAFPRIDRATGEPRPGWPDVVGSVEASTPDGAGGFFIGGDFSHVGGVARANLAHITADGAVDPAFAPVVTGEDGHHTIATLARIGTTLYLGGTLTSVGGQPRSSLAAVDTTTGAPTAFAPALSGGLPTIVSAINGRRVGPTTTLWVGGSFAKVGAATRVGFASFTDGTLNTLAPVVDGSVEAIEPDGLSGLFLGGTFTTVNGATRRGVARITGSEGTTTSAFDANLAGGGGDPQEAAVFDLVRTTAGLYVAGDFETVGAAPRPYLALVDAASGAVGGWTPDADPAAPHRWLRDVAVDTTTGTVFAGGRGLPLRAYDVASGARAAWHPLGANEVATIEPAGSEVVVGGDITTVGGVVRDGFAEIDLLTGRPTELDVNVADGLVMDLAARGTALFVVGTFSKTTGAGGDTALRGAAVLDTSAGRWTTFRLEPHPDDPSLWAQVAVAGPTVWLSTGVAVRGFRDDGAGAGTAARLPLMGSVDGAGTIDALAGTPDTVFAGGSFTKFQSLQLTPSIVLKKADRAHLVALDGQGTILPWDPGADGTVHALAVEGATVFAGGAFTTAGGGAPRPGLAGLDAASGAATPLTSSEPGAVHALTPADGTLFVARPQAPALAVIDAVSGAPTTWRPGVVRAPGSGGTTIDIVPAGRYGVVVAGWLRVGTGPVRTANFAVFPDPTVTLPGDGAPAPAGGGTATPAVPGAPGASTRPAVDDAPVLSGLKLSRRTFRVGRRATALAAARVPTGTTIRFRLSEVARVRFVVERALAGRRVGRSCRKPTRALRRKRRCTRYARRGVITRAGREGANRVVFSGRLGRRALPRGRYRLLVQATDRAGQRSARRTVAFAVRR